MSLFKTFTVCAIGVLAAAAASSCLAGDVTTTLGAATDYHSKGISKSLDDGSLSIAAEWAPKDSLVYAGLGAATIDQIVGASYESDIKVGVRPRALGWTLDFALFYRAFPDATAGADNDYVEARAQASRSFGPIALRLLTWETPDNFGAAEEANWTEARASWALNSKTRASAAFGHQDQQAAPTYSAWNAGIAVRPLPNLEIDLRWYDTDAHGFGPRFQGEAVASVNYVIK